MMESSNKQFIYTLLEAQLMTAQNRQMAAKRVETDKVALFDATCDAVDGLKRHGQLRGEKTLSLETIHAGLSRGGRMARQRMLDAGCVSVEDIPSLKKWLRVGGEDE
jgi:hypothetical protein